MAFTVCRQCQVFAKQGGSDGHTESGSTERRGDVVMTDISDETLDAVERDRDQQREEGTW